MQDVMKWADKWGIPERAIVELRESLGVLADPWPTDDRSGRESDVQSRVRVAESRKGARLWRNNVGAYRTESGAFVRYGLANDSHDVNLRIKSSDLIGIRPVTIGPEHVGRVLGQFVAREVKRPGWKYRGTPREVAQERFIALVASMGGDAKFISY